MIFEISYLEAELPFLVIALNKKNKFSPKSTLTPTNDVMNPVMNFLPLSKNRKQLKLK